MGWSRPTVAEWSRRTVIYRAMYVPSSDGGSALGGALCYGPAMGALALSETVTTGLIGAGAALIGALVGGSASFGGTWWEQRSARKSNRAEAIRNVVAEFIAIYGGAPVRLSYAESPAAFDEQLVELRTRLWTPRAQLRMYGGTQAIDAVMHRVYVELGSLEGQYPIDMHVRSRLIRIVEELADVTAEVISCSRGHQEPASGPGL